MYKPRVHLFLTNPIIHLWILYWNYLIWFDLLCFPFTWFSAFTWASVWGPIIISWVTHTHPSINSSPCSLSGSNAFEFFWGNLDWSELNSVFEIQNLVNCRLSVETLVLDSLLTETRCLGWINSTLIQNHILVIS